MAEQAAEQAVQLDQALAAVAQSHADGTVTATVIAALGAEAAPAAAAAAPPTEAELREWLAGGARVVPTEASISPRCSTRCRPATLPKHGASSRALTTAGPEEP